MPDLYCKRCNAKLRQNKKITKRDGEHCDCCIVANRNAEAVQKISPYNMLLVGCALDRVFRRLRERHLTHLSR